MDKAKVTALLKQIDEFSGDADKVAHDDALRRKLVQASRKLSQELETPAETWQRIAYLPLQIVVARIAVDLDLFGLLTKASTPSSVAALAEQTNSEPLLLGRILRYLAATDMIEETSEDHFGAVSTTRLFATPASRGSIIHQYDTAFPSWQGLPQFLAETGYVNSTDPYKCAAQLGLKTALPFFQWLPRHPHNLEAFNHLMTFQRYGQPTFLDVFPVEEKLLRGATANTPVFVDVAGGVGYQSAAFREKFPDAPGRVILQDLPAMIEQAITKEGVEKMEYDFWTAQPVKGARAYYMRNIMHDYPDDKCMTILGNMREAMAADSVIMIDDMVLPSEGQNHMQCYLDLIMLTALAGMERSRKQWQALIDKAGLTIQRIHAYTPDLQDSVIVVGL